ncbi:heme peroxidase [Xylariales sp. AK1849]|nr:heme peroxidase [Xylariales sp. AK1849]
MHRIKYFPYLLASAKLIVAMFYYPNPQIALLEHILVDNWGAYASNFSSAITPCTNYVTMVGEPSVRSGRTTAAQWIRVAFHDFITGDISTGTGGIDASIGFETFRGENKGSAFNDSFTFWRPFLTIKSVVADLVALGTAMSVSLCGGKHIQYQPGRVDAVHADPTTGVPEAGTDLEETLAQFARAGFNREDSIGLTACGHTMGSVHAGGFPEVSPQSAITPNNTNGGVNFDVTRGAFDTNVVHEYIDNTGQKGGPLVTSFNETSRSDLRLFESDANKTMQELYAMGDGFQDVCVDLMGRMLNTVPAHVELQSAISPMPVKPINVTWDFDANDQLVLSGKIRVLWGAPVIAHDITVDFASHPMQLQAEVWTGSTVFGSTGRGDGREYGVARYYPFSISGRNLTRISSFTVSHAGFSGQNFPLNWGYFIVPSMTTSDGQTVLFTVAIPQSRADALPQDLTVEVAAPVPQPLTLAPKLVKSTGTWSSGSRTKGDFVLWSGVYDVGHRVTGAISLTLTQGHNVLDTLLLNAGVAGW